MDHVAIMKKSWGLTQKVLLGQKVIESRWYKNKYRPWNRIEAGDIIYFKDSGEPISIKAKVKKVLQFENLTPKKVREVLNKYAKDDGVEESRISEFYEMFKDKKYCLLIFLKDAQDIEPFEINKNGFGNMSAWISIEDIKKIKLSKVV